MIVLTAIAAFIARLASAELYQWLPGIALRVVRRQAAKLPPGRRERMQEEWSAEIDATHGHIRKLIFALGLLWGLDDLIQGHHTMHAEPGELKIEGPTIVPQMQMMHQPTITIEAVGTARSTSTLHAVGSARVSFVVDSNVLISAISSSEHVFPRFLEKDDPKGR